VLLHTARPRQRHRLELWLELLLAAAAGQEPRQGVLVARGERDFGLALRLLAPAAEAARSELQRLAALRDAWRQRCWPVPPETGWMLLEKGTNPAIDTWEGSERSRGERQEPEQALCFGVELSGTALLADGAVAAYAEELLGPLRGQLA